MKKKTAKCLRKMLTLALVFTLLLASGLVANAAVGDHMLYESESNNSMSSADRIYNDYTVDGSLSGTDLDYFRFTLSQRSKVTVTAVADYASFMMGLYNSSDTIIGAVTYLGYNDGLYRYGMSYTLNSGTFYLCLLDSEQRYINNYMLYISIEPVATSATGISIDKDQLQLDVGANETLTATVTPSNTTDAVTWSSSNTGVATVDQNGKVVAVGAGSATITAAAGNYRDTCTVSVNCSHSEKVLYPEKTDATCLDQGYNAYYLCACGKYFDADGVAEISGIPYTGTGDHVYDTVWDKDSSTDSKHFHKCTVCGSLDEGEAHSVGTSANCKDHAVCAECDAPYGSVDTNVHKTPDDFNYTKIDESEHKKVYACCEAVAISNEDHFYDDENDTVCNACGYDKAHYCGNADLVSGESATCTETGTKDSYQCSCGKVYFDAACEVQVVNSDDLIIQPTGHIDADDDNTCDACGIIINIDEFIPTTGDNGGMMVWFVVAFAAVIALVMVTAYGKKKENYA